MVGLQPWAVVIAPLAAAGVALGFGSHGLLRAKDELLVRGRARVGYGVVLLVMSLAGIGIAYRLLQRTEVLRGLLG